MATSLTTKLNLDFSWKFISTDATSSRQIVDANSINVFDTLTNGTVIDTADLKWDDRRTVNSGADDDIDLAGVLTDPFGTTITFAKICGIIIRNRNTTAGEILHVGGGSATFHTFLGATGDLIKIGPDGVFCLWNPSLAGYAVTATTADILRLSGVGGDITYDICLIGRSA